MQNKTESVKQAETRKLEKPVRDEQELQREELVAYTDESGGTDNGGGNGGVP